MKDMIKMLEQAAPRDGMPSVDKAEWLHQRDRLLALLRAELAQGEPSPGRHARPGYLAGTVRVPVGRP